MTVLKKGLQMFSTCILQSVPERQRMGLAMGGETGEEQEKVPHNSRRRLHCQGTKNKSVTTTVLKVCTFFHHVQPAAPCER
eukprot:3831078-Rhodomonas_salina.1